MKKQKTLKPYSKCDGMCEKCKYGKEVFDKEYNTKVHTYNIKKIENDGYHNRFSL